MSGMDVNNINLLNSIATTNNVSNVRKPTELAINFSTNGVSQPRTQKYPDTFATLAQLNGSITPEMAADVLATPCIQINFMS